MYDLKQALWVWYDKIGTFFKQKGFHNFAIDLDFYIQCEHVLVMVIVLYVDDVIIIRGGSIDHTRNTKESLQFEFEMIEMGLLHLFLGLDMWHE